jgi:hypothetical protein
VQDRGHGEREEGEMKSNGRGRVLHVRATDRLEEFTEQRKRALSWE